MSALINDSYSRDISVKVRTSKEMKRKNGEFIGLFTMYGFLKDPKNKNKLIVDETAGPVVKDIYTMKLSGLSANAIADRLNAAGILSPMEHKAALGISCVSGLNKNPKASWFSKSVLRILQDEIYTGTLVQGKSEKINYKVIAECKEQNYPFGRPQCSTISEKFYLSGYPYSVLVDKSGIIRKIYGGFAMDENEAKKLIDELKTDIIKLME